MIAPMSIYSGVAVTARNLLLEESPLRTNLGGIHGGERGLR